VVAVADHHKVQEAVAELVAVEFEELLLDRLAVTVEALQLCLLEVVEEERLLVLPQVQVVLVGQV
jgi:hypothetical protein